MSRHRHPTLDAPHNPYASPYTPPVAHHADPGAEPVDWTIERRIEHSTDQMLAGLADIREALVAAREPARYRVVQLTTTTSAVVDQAGDTWASIGILNPNPYNILLGLNGPATTAGRALPVPRNSSIILPIHVQDLEIGADPADIVASGDALVHVFRYRTVQHLDLGAWA